MARQLLSPSWYRVADLRPRLRSHARIHRHEYRGERWYVLEDRISRRTHRFTPGAYYMIGLMDGNRSMDTIWDAAVKRLGDDVPTQDEMIQMLGQLHVADILQCEVTPDVDELLRRSHRFVDRGRLAKWLSPLAVKIPLLDPDRLLERWLPWYQPLFGAIGAAIWLVVVGWALVSAIQHWGELSKNITDQVLAPDNLLIIGLVFPLIKACHEFGHACAVKAWGGEVHEMGIMLLVLMPVPYVDASAANAFAAKRRRMIVGAAGMIVELFIASIALYFWLQMEPGFLRSVLFNVMLIAGVSTVLFNANPLLRFDGYYMLSDLIEIPNLRQRANQYLAELFQRSVFGLEIPPSASTRGERIWFVCFAIASFIYRVTITFAIAVFVASAYLFVGILLAAWTVISAFVLPVVMMVGYIIWSPKLTRRRTRAAVAAGVLALALFALVFVLPVPSWTNAQGVVWVPEQGAVRTGADGFVRRVLVEPGQKVDRGDPLIEAEDPALTVKVRAMEGQKSELEARYQAEFATRLVKAQQTLDQLRSVEADLARAREREADLVARSPADGVFTVPSPQDLPGRYVKKGELLAYVVPQSTLMARVVVPQQSAMLVRHHTERVLVKLIEQVEDTIPARIVREVPAASDRLPSLALAQAGGGEVALDPASTREPKTLQRHFEFEIELPSARAAGIGERVYVRFEHGTETIADQVWRSVRQLFLRQFTA